MNAHPDRPDLSAYLDGELPRAQRGALKRHLQACPSCRAELSAIERVKAALAGAPRRTLPEDIAAAWGERLGPPSWRTRLQELLTLPQVWGPALAAAGLLLLLQAGRTSQRRAEAIPIEALAAAHSRYEAEGLVPDGDPTAANFWSELVALNEPR